MMSKHFLWRRSNRALSLLFFLLIPTYSFSADTEGAAAGASDQSHSMGKQEDSSCGAPLLAKVIAYTAYHTSMDRLELNAYNTFQDRLESKLDV